MTTDYPQPLISVDAVPVLIDKDQKLKIVLGKRQYEPYINDLALPGVLLGVTEKLEEGVYRALQTKTFITPENIKGLHNIGAFDSTDRDPRGATVSIAYLALLNSDTPINGETTSIIPAETLYKKETILPFDHNDIIIKALNSLEELLFSSKTVTHNLLGDTFNSKKVKTIIQQLSTLTGNHHNDLFLANLTRNLRSTGWLTQATQPEQTTPNRGRPSNTWTWK